MFFLRFFLIFGMLTHPICFHCHAQMQAQAKADKGAPEFESVPDVDTVKENSPQTTLCTKAPIRSESKFHCDLLFKSVVHEVALIDPTPLQWTEKNGQNRSGTLCPLYLSLAVLLI